MAETPQEDLENDVKLTRLSDDFIEDFENSLAGFLYVVDKNGATKIRRKVRTRETDRLVNLVDNVFPKYNVILGLTSALA